MIDALLSTYFYCFFAPFPFFFIAWVARLLKNYFTDATNINVRE